MKLARLSPMALLLVAACGDDPERVVPPRTGSTGTDEPAAIAPATAGATPPPVAPAPIPQTGLSVGTPLTAVDLARAVLQLPLAAERTGLAATSADGVAFQLVLPPDADASRATALARALGNVPTAPIPWPPSVPTYTIELLAVRGSQLLMPGPATTGHPHDRLPDGAFFVGVLGTFSTGASTREGENAWVYGFASDGKAGWLKASALAVEEGCVLTHDALAHALGMRLDDEALDTSLVGNMHLYRGGQSKRGTFVANDRFVALLERSSNCRTVTLDTRIELSGEGPLDELHYARDQERGDTFVAISTDDENATGSQAWSVYPPRAVEPDITFTAATHWTVPTRSRATVHFGPRRGPGGARGYWAFSVKMPGSDPTFYTSDGTRFTEVGTEPSAGAPTGETPEAAP